MDAVLYIKRFDPESNVLISDKFTPCQNIDEGVSSIVEAVQKIVGINFEGVEINFDNGIFCLSTEINKHNSGSLMAYHLTIKRYSDNGKYSVFACETKSLFWTNKFINEFKILFPV